MKEFHVKNEFIELRAKGLSFDKISKKIKVSKPTLIEWANEFDLEIANLRSFELEALQEKYFLTKQHLIKQYGEILRKLNNEIKKRDLSDVKTGKLVELIIKTSHELDRLRIDFNNSNFRTHGEMQAIRSELKFQESFDEMLREMENALIKK
ncbi:hypothetical protein FGU46_10340 [Methanobacterium sp. CWC-01]|uniref:hypothetical protein n=1 Tax=Methanobacterium aridiramus TaxID=2584467 RepID=UPI0025791343|nr:hypothetical protein [Methanobacterium sp. CWC-01]WJI10458.1 hypothetical protein FGU46_10340 [Methanobacterium sp. CWC-01]